MFRAPSGGIDCALWAPREGRPGVRVANKLSPSLSWGGMEVRYYIAIPPGSFEEVSGQFWTGLGKVLIRF